MKLIKVISNSMPLFLLMTISVSCSYDKMVFWASVKTVVDLNRDVLYITSLTRENSSSVKMHIYVLIVNMEELSILILSGIIDSLLESLVTLSYGNKR
jgi:hypothetical protein